MFTIELTLVYNRSQSSLHFIQLISPQFTTDLILVSKSAMTIGNQIAGWEFTGRQLQSDRQLTGAVWRTRHSHHQPSVRLDSLGDDHADNDHDDDDDDDHDDDEDDDHDDGSSLEDEAFSPSAFSQTRFSRSQYYLYGSLKTNKFWIYNPILDI